MCVGGGGGGDPEYPSFPTPTNTSTRWGDRGVVTAMVVVRGRGGGGGRGGRGGGGRGGGGGGGGGRGGGGDHGFEGDG